MVYTDNKMITLNSDYGQSLNGTKKSSVMFNFNSILSDEEHIIRASISVMNAQIPSSFYVINEYNNQLLYNYNNNINLYITINVGNYNAYTLITALNTAFASKSTPIIVSINKLTGILTFTAPYLYTFLTCPNTIMFILGLLTEDQITADPVLSGFKVVATKSRTYPFTVSASNNTIPYIASFQSGSALLIIPQATYTSASKLVVAINNAIQTIQDPRFPPSLVASSNFLGVISLTTLGNIPFRSISGFATSILPDLFIYASQSSPIYQVNPYIENFSFITNYYEGLSPPTYPVELYEKSFILSPINLGYGETTFTIPNGTYNETALLTAIQLLFDTVPQFGLTIPQFFIKVSSSGNLVISTRQTTISSFAVISPENSATTLLGFSPSNQPSTQIGYSVRYTYTYPEYIVSSGTYTANYPLNLLGIKTVSIHSSQLAISSFSSKNLGTSDTLITIPVNSSPFGLITYVSNNPLDSHILTSKTIEAIDIQLTDEKDNFINFNNINWSITLCLSVEREEIPKIPKLIPYLRQIENKPLGKENEKDKSKNEKELEILSG